MLWYGQTYVTYRSLRSLGLLMQHVLFVLSFPPCRACRSNAAAREVQRAWADRSSGCRDGWVSGGCRARAVLPAASPDGCGSLLAGLLLARLPAAGEDARSPGGCCVGPKG